MKKFCLSAFTIFTCLNLLAQNEYSETWKQTVQWDGATHWSRYMQTAAGYMGPNSLPVPFNIGEGSIDTVSSFSFSASRHQMKGDKTTNLTIYFNHVIVKDLVSIDLFMVPIEWFKMTDEIRILRRVPPHFYNARSANGDLHGHINLQLFNKYRDKIHIVLRAGMRYPTSNKLGAARFTDMPGYFFDLNAGKPLYNGWNIFGNVGFYVWETIDRKLNRQDDAFLFGGGVSYHKKSFHWQVAISGYLGYMEQTLDKPIVARMSFTKTWPRYKSFIRLQQGIHHFKYSSVEGGMGYVFKWKSMKLVK